MPQVVMFDRGDHWEIIGDYSGSPRHAKLTEAEWQADYAGPDYADMRATQAGAVAAIAPRGVGKWKKDWSGPFP